MIDKAFGEVIKRLRNDRDLSQEGLGYRAGLHRTYVSQLERGLKSPSLRTIEKIATVLEVDLADLMRLLQQERANVPSRQ